MTPTYKKWVVGAVTTAVIASPLSTLPALAADEEVLSFLSPSAQEVIEDDNMTVQGISSIPGDSKVTLMWNPVYFEDSKLSSYRIFYGTTSVESGEATEYSDTIEVSIDEQESADLFPKYDITGLENGTTYYFSIKAVTPDNQASSEYSSELNVVPQQADEETTEITEEGEDIFSVIGSSALTTDLIKIEFSREVVIPETQSGIKGSFIIETKDLMGATEFVNVKNIFYRTNYFLVSEDDLAKKVESDKVLYIQVDPALTPGTDYKVTVTASGIKDTEGNIINTSVSDSSEFIGVNNTEISEEEEKEVNAAITDNTVPNIETTSENNTDTANNSINLDMTDTSNTDELPTVTTEDATDTGNVSDAENSDISETTTDRALENEAETEVSAEDENLKGAAINDISALDVSFKKQVEDFILTLSWEQPTGKNFSEQFLYISEDGGNTWGAKKELSGTVKKHSLLATPESEYTFRVTAQEAGGIETQGVLKTIKVPSLTDTGAPLFLALGLALMGGAFVRMRKS